MNRKSDTMEAVEAQPGIEVPAMAVASEGRVVVAHAGDAGKFDRADSEVDQGRPLVEGAGKGRGFCRAWQNSRIFKGVMMEGAEARPGIVIPAMAVASEGRVAVRHEVDGALGTAQRGRFDKGFASAEGRRGHWDVDQGRHVVGVGQGVVVAEGNWGPDVSVEIPFVVEVVVVEGKVRASSVSPVFEFVGFGKHATERGVVLVHNGGVVEIAMPIDINKIMAT
jgi:hypothetical protein